MANKKAEHLNECISVKTCSSEGQETPKTNKTRIQVCLISICTEHSWFLVIMITAIIA